MVARALQRKKLDDAPNNAAAHRPESGGACPERSVAMRHGEFLEVIGYPFNDIVAS